MGEKPACSTRRSKFEEYVFTSEDDITVNQRDDIIFEIESLDSDYQDNISMDIDEMSNATVAAEILSSESLSEDDNSINDQSS